MSDKQPDAFEPTYADVPADGEPEPTFADLRVTDEPTLTATTSTTVEARLGEVVELGVRATGDEPVRLYAEGIDAPLRLTPGEDGDLRAFLAVGPGATRVTAHAGAASPVEFTITTDPAAVEPAADTEGDDS